MRKIKSKDPFPCRSVRMIPAAQISANDYNPNQMDASERRLLVESIARDGLTQPVVVRPAAGNRYIVVDGFHRCSVLTREFGLDEVPCVVVEPAPGEEYGSTVRHNRARGRHRVDLTIELVRRMADEGMELDQIAKQTGMTGDEILRMVQIGGIASAFKDKDFSRAWEWEGK